MKRCYTEKCEWNPDYNRPAYQNEFHADALWEIGEGEWFLCDNCISLFPFKDRLKKKIYPENDEKA